MFFLRLVAVLVGCTGCFEVLISLGCGVGCMVDFALESARMIDRRSVLDLAAGIGVCRLSQHSLAGFLARLMSATTA